jgi:hypothetical protein
MYTLKPLRDPLGNNILFPLQQMKFSQENYADMSKVITSPAFLISEKNKKLYFFRLIDKNINLLVEAHFIGKTFVVKTCMENPSAEYVSGLLRKGALLSF